MNKSLRVAVIGCGYWGPNLARNFSQNARTTLTYVCDIDESRLEPLLKTYPSVQASTDTADVFASPDVDAVAIAVPVARHFDIARDALLAGKHVLLEKPLTDSSEHARELIRIASEKNLVLMVDHTFEYAQAIRKIRDIIDSGELGRIYYVRAEWLNLGLLQPDVNVVWDLAAHVVSILCFVTGLKPTRLSAHASAYIRDDIEEVAHLHLTFPDSITAYVTVSWLEPRKTRSITVVGGRKMLVYDLMNEEEQIKIYDKGIDLTETADTDVNQFRINYRYGDIYSPNIEKIEPLKAMCSHFARSILDGTRPGSDGDSGLNVVRVIEAAEKSFRDGGMEIRLDP